MRNPFARKSRSRSRRPVQLRLERLEDRCVPAIISVSAGGSIQTIAQAAAVAQNGDTIQIQAGTYTSQEAVFTQSNLTIEGVGGTAIFNDSGYTIQNEKGIFDIRGNNVTIKNIECEYAHDIKGSFGDNFAGIRGEGNTLTLQNCILLHNDDGILINNDPNFTTDNNSLLVTNCEFGYNGYGDGYSHNIYVGEITSFTMEASYSHDANQGHLVKSRALTTNLLYNYLVDGTTGGGSSEIDIPYGGNSYVIGNIVEKDAGAANHNFLTYNTENGPSTYSQQLYLVNNTFVNDVGGGATYVFDNSTNPPSTLLIENNIFAGGGTIASVGYTNVTNLVSNNPGFVSWNPSTIGGNYQLTSSSPAVNAGTQPGSANGVSLVPTQEYVASTGSQARTVAGSAIDIGAYEYVPQVSIPATPTNFVATAGNGQANLTWAAVSGATSYNVYRGSASGGETLLASGITTTSFTDSGLSNGDNYFYQVAAVNSAGTSSRTSEARATPQAPGGTVWIEDGTPLGAALASDGGDAWTWSASNPAPFSGTLDQQSNLASGEHQHYFTNATQTMTVHSGDTLYVYVYLNPTNPPSEVMLQWNVNGSWEHRAYWGANSIGWGTNGTVSRQYMGALPATGGWVRLAVPASAVGLDGATVSGMAFTLYGGQADWDRAGTVSAPAAPTGLTATAGNGQVTLTWAASSGATSYNVYRSTASGTEVQVASGIAGTSFTNTGLGNGTAYYYKVTAVNGNGESGYSGEASATPKAPASGSASFVALNTTTEGSWSSSYGADGYDISQGAASVPSYASVTICGNANYVWNSSTTDPRAVQNPSTGTGLAACWYSGSSFTIDLNITDGQTHEVSLYALDWDSYGPRQEQINVIDPGTGAVLDSRTVSSFSGGDYLAWNVSGHVQFQVTNLVSGSNAVISGLFFGGPAKTAVVGNGTGLTGQYYSDTNLSNLVLTRTDSTVNFTWPNDTAPVAGLPNDNWSVKWTGQVQAQYTEAYTFKTVSDDGVRLYVNGQLVINDWTYHAATTDTSATIQLVAGQKYMIEMDYFEGTGAATSQLFWSSPSTPLQIIPTSQLYTSAVSAAVNLSAAYNRVGIVTDGTAFSGGLDGGGSALSANQLGQTVTWNNQTFQLGSANTSSVVSATGQTIALPAGNYSSLSFLATAVNGNQPNLTFTVTYTDGTTQTFTQSISDWYTPQGYSGESTAVTMSYRDTSSGGMDNRPFYVYGCRFALNPAKTVQSITLPNDGNVEVLAMNVSA